MSQKVKPRFTNVKRRLIAKPPAGQQTKAMLDRETWKTRFVAAARAEIDSGRIDRAALARHFESLRPPQKPATKQAVYAWFRDGKISDDRLAQVCEFLGLDLPQLKFQAVFAPVVTAPAPVARKPGRKTTADVICEKVHHLDPSVQQHLLMLIETILAASNPRAINYEAEAHHQALAVHEKRARYAK